MHNANRQIVIVGQRTASVQSCSTILSNAGFEIDITPLYKEGTEGEREKKAGLIIVDMHSDLPVPQQDDLSGAVRIPVIALVEGALETEQRRALYAKGVLDCILLPVIAHELLFRVTTVINSFDCPCIYNPYSTAGVFSGSSEAQHNGPDEARVVLVQKTCRYLSEHLNDKISLKHIALVMGSNRSTLAALFKLVLGQSVFAWLNQQRLLKARSLLQHSTLPIEQIAYEVGYEHCASFSHAYKKQFDLTPRQQRKGSTGAA